MNSDLQSAAARRIEPREIWKDSRGEFNSMTMRKGNISLLTQKVNIWNKSDICRAFDLHLRNMALLTLAASFKISSSLLVFNSSCQMQCLAARLLATFLRVLVVSLVGIHRVDHGRHQGWPPRSSSSSDHCHLSTWRTQEWPSRSFMFHWEIEVWSGVGLGLI